MRFRELDTGLKNPAWNMASDKVLLELQKEPTLRFLSFSPPSVLVGYFQSVEQEVREEYCKEKGIAINRRITGGGAIYFDPSQVGWEIIAPLNLFSGYPSQLYSLFGKGVAEGLRVLGIPAEFKPRNDIEVRGKKISGMGGVTFKDGFLFQGTLLVEDRIEEMLYALRVPIEKLKPKEIDSVRERVTCIERELGRVPDREEIKWAIKEGLKKTLGIQTEKKELVEEEIESIERILPYFSSPEWIYKIKLSPGSQGLLTGVYRSSYGTIKVNMIVNKEQKILRTTIITGDFFIDPPNVIFDLERMLKNIHFDERRIIKIIEDFLAPYPEIPGDEFIKACKEVFRKWRWVVEGFTPDEANHLFAVNFSPGERFAPTIFLFPYCAKKTDCPFRYKRECPACGECTVGDGYNLATQAGLKCITVTSFEDLIKNFYMMKKSKITDYIGSCCEPFYVKHQEEFRKSGLKGLLIDIENSTCYDLGKTKEAYRGRFKNQTQLNIPLIKKVLEYIRK